MDTATKNRIYEYRRLNIEWHVAQSNAQKAKRRKFQEYGDDIAAGKVKKAAIERDGYNLRYTVNGKVADEYIHQVQDLPEFTTLQQELIAGNVADTWWDSLTPEQKLAVLMSVL